ncbi:hypothetical protein LY76DRAFT_411374 [Colletotrichum caudatum]|nr:hypothetical protein LY76DRAFT_411374 [Colletotrichum caudatum]
MRWRLAAQIVFMAGPSGRRRWAGEPVVVTGGSGASFRETPRPSKNANAAMASRMARLEQTSFDSAWPVSLGCRRRWCWWVGMVSVVTIASSIIVLCVYAFLPSVTALLDAVL